MLGKLKLQINIIEMEFLAIQTMKYIRSLGGSLFLIFFIHVHSGRIYWGLIYFAKIK